jgi:hypothetical protein
MMTTRKSLMKKLLLKNQSLYKKIPNPSLVMVKTQKKI